MEKTKEIDNQLLNYKRLILDYHSTLDLMSDKALATLDSKIADCLLFADTIGKSQLSINTKILDVGSGVGLPAIPIAINLPQHKVILVERRQRRASFLSLVIGQLGLKNTAVFNSDVRNLTKTELEGTVKIITAQAVGSFALLYNLTKHLLEESFTLITIKGNNWLEDKSELEQISKLKIVKCQEVDLKTHGKLIALDF